MVCRFALRGGSQQFEFSKEAALCQYLPRIKDGRPGAIRVLDRIDTMSLSPAQKILFFYMAAGPAYTGQTTGDSINAC